MRNDTIALWNNLLKNCGNHYAIQLDQTLTGKVHEFLVHNKIDTKLFTTAAPVFDPEGKISRLQVRPIYHFIVMLDIRKSVVADVLIYTDSNLMFGGAYIPNMHSRNIREIIMNVRSSTYPKVLEQILIIVLIMSTVTDGRTDYLIADSKYVGIDLEEWGFAEPYTVLPTVLFTDADRKAALLHLNLEHKSVIDTYMIQPKQLMSWKKSYQKSEDVTKKLIKKKIESALRVFQKMRSHLDEIFTTDVGRLCSTHPDVTKIYAVVTTYENAVGGLIGMKVLGKESLKPHGAKYVTATEAALASPKAKSVAPKVRSSSETKSVAVQASPKAKSHVATKEIDPTRLTLNINILTSAWNNLLNVCAIQAHAPLHITYKRMHYGSIADVDDLSIYRSLSGMLAPEVYEPDVLIYLESDGAKIAWSIMKIAPTYIYIKSLRVNDQIETPYTHNQLRLILVINIISLAKLLSIPLVLILATDDMTDLHQIFHRKNGSMQKLKYNYVCDLRDLSIGKIVSAMIPNIFTSCTHAHDYTHVERIWSGQTGSSYTPKYLKYKAKYLDLKARL